MAARFRGGDRPHFVELVTHDTWPPDRMGGLVPQSWRFSRCPQYDLEQRPLDDVNVLFVPGTHDQIFLKSMERQLVAYLESGGHFVINGHIFLPWLPCLSRFTAVCATVFFICTLALAFLSAGNKVRTGGDTVLDRPTAPASAAASGPSVVIPGATIPGAASAATPEPPVAPASR